MNKKGQFKFRCKYKYSPSYTLCKKMYKIDNTEINSCELKRCNVICNFGVAHTYIDWVKYIIYKDLINKFTVINIK